MEKGPRVWRIPKHDKGRTSFLGEANEKTNPLSLQRQLANARSQIHEDLNTYDSLRKQIKEDHHSYNLESEQKPVPIWIDIELLPKDKRERLKYYRSVSENIKKKTQELI